MVAHCVSVMVVQAGVSEALLDASPERAREPLRAVQETGRHAIAELTRTLGLLRGGSADPEQPLAPQPGVDELPQLVERFTASGLHVELASVGDVRPLPPGVDLTVFRITQEALTNTLKHAGPGAGAHVELRYLPRAVEIEVTDDGTATTEPAASGHGLIGMRERVSVFGGSLEAGVRPDGGFRVFASLPVAEADDPGPGRRRPGARPRRLPADPRRASPTSRSSARPRTARHAVDAGRAGTAPTSY